MHLTGARNTPLDPTSFQAVHPEAEEETTGADDVEKDEATGTDCWLRSLSSCFVGTLQQINTLFAPSVRIAG